MNYEMIKLEFAKGDNFIFEIIYIDDKNKDCILMRSILNQLLFYHIMFSFGIREMNKIRNFVRGLKMNVSLFCGIQKYITDN